MKLCYFFPTWYNGIYVTFAQKNPTSQHGSTLRCVAAFSTSFGSTGAEVDPSKAAELLAAAISIAAEQVLKQSQATSGVTGLIDIKSLS